MDTTPEYIKMCEKAKEIQKEKDWPKWYNSGPCCMWPKWEAYLKPWYLSQEHHGVKDSIWLPRQDQLQAMVIKTGTATNLACYFHSWIQDKGNLASHDSMEQLWLAFVMYEKYGKVWNGTDWIVK